MNDPRLTIVVASRTGMRESAAIVRHLAGQTIASSIELIVVAPRGLVSAAEAGAVSGFAMFQLLEVDRVENRGLAAAYGLLQARAPLAGMCENHAFPSADSLERLILSHGPGDGAVAPTMRSANPETRRSLCMFTATYGVFEAPPDAASMEMLPLHNSVYRTDLLRQLGERLPELMRDETRLQAELRRQGYGLRVVEGAVSWHVNESRWVRVATDPFILARRFGAARAATWPWTRRGLYACALPVVAGIRFRLLLRVARRGHDTKARVLELLPMLAVFAVAGALGEAWGGLRPGARPSLAFEEHEFHIRGRLAGVPPTYPWIRDIVARLSPDLP